RDDDRLHGVVPAQALEHLREERVRATVVERHVGRRADDHERAGGVDRPLRKHGWVWLEAGEVVLLLQPFVAAELLGPDAVALEPVGRDRLWDDDSRGRPAAELVLEPGVLVVERRRARN